MPTYLCHGFRWHRRSIRVYVVVQNIDDAAPEWIIAPHSSTAILESFYALFDFLPEPDQTLLDRSTEKATALREEKKKKRTLLGGGSSKKGKGSGGEPASAAAMAMAAVSADGADFDVPSPSVHDEEDAVLSNDWSAVKLLEEYDPSNLEEVSRPYAFVADYVVRVDLNVSVAEEIARYEERLAKRGGAEDRPMAGTVSDEFVKATKKSSGASAGGGSSSAGKKAGWLEKLRDQLQRNEDIRWYVVVCGDEERLVPEGLEEPEPPRMKGVLDGDDFDEVVEQDREPEREREREREKEREIRTERSRDGRQTDRQRERDVQRGKGDWDAVPARSHQGASSSSSGPRTPGAESRGPPSGGSGGSEKPAKQGGLRRIFGKKQDGLG